MDGGCTVSHANGPCKWPMQVGSTAEPGRPTLYELRVSMFIQIAGVAQSAEPLVSNQQVAGSYPVPRSTFSPPDRRITGIPRNRGHPA